ncbi:zinc-binding dehydrogenase, partial [Rhizobium leguminosarum]|uniref:zinc-binding dehydrogenase n=1 Tax=Rhizobium leguminosarum TaxID=384 RepID=UPI003F946591
SVGLAAVMAARIVGASRIIAVEVNETRLALAAELCATDIVNGKTSDAVAAIMALIRDAPTIRAAITAARPTEPIPKTARTFPG